MKYLVLGTLSILAAFCLQSCGRGTVLRGEKGDPGEIGPVGPQGPAGTPVSSIEQVRLCYDDTSSYPEYALKIDSQLYAVYWGTTPTSNGQKQAFLALIIPGTYQSTGGNGCQFRVELDGSISNL